jgi:Skp family chaperone for outer membrane proteins
MSERTKLLKKAVMTGVGASTSVDRIKEALGEAMQDLVKVGQDLLGELEVTGEHRTDSFQQYIKKLQNEASKRSSEVEKKVSSKVQTQLKKTAKEFGFVTREEVDELLERMHELEVMAGVADDHEPKRGRRKKSSD